LSQSTGSIKLRMTFRILVILQLVSLIVLSPLYGTYVDLYAQGDTEINIAGSTSGFLLRWAFVLVLLVLYLATYVGLLWFRRWARTLLPVALHDIVKNLEDICEEERQLRRQIRYHHWLHGWLMLHVPLSLALLLLGCAHAIMALRY